MVRILSGLDFYQPKTSMAAWRQLLTLHIAWRSVHSQTKQGMRTVLIPNTSLAGFVSAQEACAIRKIGACTEAFAAAFTCCRQMATGVATQMPSSVHVLH